MADTGIHTMMHDGVCIITLMRADKRNALTQPMYAALTDAVTAAGEDPAVSVIRLRGDGADFTAGNDLNDLQVLAQAGEAVETQPVFRFLHAVVDCPRPLVAEVRGNAVGLGTTLLLHCEAVIAATDATFAMPFVQLGLVPEFGSTLLLPELVGPQRAARLLILGERFDAREGERLGLVSQVCEPPALEAVAGAWCRRIATAPAGAVAATRSLLRGPQWRARLHEAVDREAAVFAEQLNSVEHRQAVAAFFGAEGDG
ncbi:enoyl-CoA hydratase-related protein [Arhodomonas aquaeolei]|uniref:enoyl-CoA hydratase-related protein n=1 Tax=Arhodomonas aquaeolei TaxID=2369 RepID=UPI00036378DA|nr:enoyl-CoA hydratase-related protein [Arhodomonas aquaeolei]